MQHHVSIIFLPMLTYCYMQFSSLNTSTMVYMLPFGLSGATRWNSILARLPSQASCNIHYLITIPHILYFFLVSIRVANELGAGRPKAARLAAYTALFLATTEGILVAMFMISVRKLWGHCYSNEEEVVSYVAEMLMFIAVSHFIDANQSVLSGLSKSSIRWFLLAMFLQQSYVSNNAKFRYCKRLWLAKSRCNCQFGSLLPMGDTCWCCISFFLPCWRKGTFISFYLVLFNSLIILLGFLKNIALCVPYHPKLVHLWASDMDVEAFLGSPHDIVL